MLEFKFQLDEEGMPWLYGIKGDFTFKTKDNIFDDIKAHLINGIIKIAEKKIHRFKEHILKNYFIDEEGFKGFSANLVRRAKLTVKQLEAGQMYKRKQVKLKDALKLA
jgi:hypothetical protein